MWRTYEQDLDRRNKDLHAPVHGEAYRAQPSRRSYIPKDDGSIRQLLPTTRFLPFRKAASSCGVNVWTQR